jgi:hypothetical protein
MAGRDRPTCRYEHRRRRPGLTQRYGVVTEEAIVALYLEHRAYAIRLARGLSAPRRRTSSTTWSATCSRSGSI